jgi:hypothetical protein
VGACVGGVLGDVDRWRAMDLRCETFVAISSGAAFGPSPNGPPGPGVEGSIGEGKCCWNAEVSICQAFVWQRGFIDSSKRVFGDGGIGVILVKFVQKNTGHRF